MPNDLPEDRASSLPALDGPRRAPASGEADALVVLIHGYGANGDDLFPLAEPLADAWPGAAFVSPNAPDDAPGGFGGRQWFPIANMNEAHIAAGVRSAAPTLNAFLDAELARWGVPPERLALFGFSQGAMLSLHVGLRRTPALAGILAFSGFLAGADALTEEIAARPPTLLVHGDQDTVVPFQVLEYSAHRLQALGVPVSAHAQRGLGHGISPEGVGLAAAHLRAIFTKDDAPAR